MIAHILKALRKPAPRVRIDLDAFNPEGKRAVYLLIGCSLFLGTPANGGDGGRAA